MQSRNEAISGHHSPQAVRQPVPAAKRRALPHGAPRAGELAGALLGLSLSVGTTVALAAVARRGSEGVAAMTQAPRPDEVLLTALAWAGVGLALWLAVGSLLAVLATLPGAMGRTAARIGERVTPVAVRKALTLALGASVGSMALPPSSVSSAGSTPVARTSGAGGAVLHAASPSPGYAPSRSAGLDRPVIASTSPGGDRPRGVPSAAALPDVVRDVIPEPGFEPSIRPPAPIRPAPARALPRPGYVPSPPPSVLHRERSQLLAPEPRVTASSHDLVTVRRGDTLWSLAARHLGRGASAAQIAHEWPRWFAANRDVMGDDPDLLLPGQELRPPASVATPSHLTSAERGARP
jgi:nucleoid-associated protein YgaU